MIENKIKIKPYWHIDMKWIVSLILIPLLAVTFLILNLYKSTDEVNGVEVSSTLLAAMYSPGSKNYDNEINEIRTIIQKSPDRTLRPFPGLDIKITEQDIEKYPVTEIKKRIFLELAKNIYDFNPAKMKLNKEGKTDVFSNFGLMAIFTKTSHQFIGKILIYGASASIIFLILLVYFSYGFGRLISPGLIFVLIGLPSVLFLTVLQKTPENSQIPLGAKEISTQQRISMFVSEVGPTISKIFQRNYIILIIVGLILILIGIVGKITQRQAKKITS